LRRAIAAAEAAAPAMKALGSWQRKAILMHCVERFTERKDELAMALCVEAGKPIKARGAARRAAHQTVTFARSMRGCSRAMPAGDQAPSRRLTHVSPQLWQRAGSALPACRGGRARCC